MFACLLVWPALFYRPAWLAGCATHFKANDDSTQLVAAGHEHTEPNRATLKPVKLKIIIIILLVVVVVVHLHELNFQPTARQQQVERKVEGEEEGEGETKLYWPAQDV